MVVRVAAGGRGTLYGAVLGAFGVNWIQSWLTTSYPDFWLLFLGGLFMGVVLFFPDGVVGAVARASTRFGRLMRIASPQAAQPSQRTQPGTISNRPPTPKAGPGAPATTTSMSGRP